MMIFSRLYKDSPGAYLEAALGPVPLDTERGEWEYSRVCFWLIGDGIPHVEAGQTVKFSARDILRWIYSRC